MSNTIASPVVIDLYHAIADRIGPKFVMLGGSVPPELGNGALNELPHSYHRSWADSPHDDGYSVHFAGDKSPSVRTTKKRYACALDVTFHRPEDIQKATARLHHWATTTKNNWNIGVLSHSPILREFAGTLDSKNVFAMDLSTYRKPFQTYGWDP